MHFSLPACIRGMNARRGGDPSSFVLFTPGKVRDLLQQDKRKTAEMGPNENTGLS